MVEILFEKSRQPDCQFGEDSIDSIFRIFYFDFKLFRY